MSSRPAIGCRSVPPAVKEIIFDEGTILTRVRELGRDLSRDYQGKDLVVVAILKGAFMFSSDLIRTLTVRVRPDFMAVSHYDRQPHNGEVRIMLDLQEDIHGKHVLVVEDIVDTGLTLNYLIRSLQQRCPRSLAVCTLLDRPELRLVEIPIGYVGFSVNDEFLIGYGLDFRGYYRDLPFVATMDLERE